MGTLLNCTLLILLLLLSQQEDFTFAASIHTHTPLLFAFRNLLDRRSDPIPFMGSSDSSAKYIHLVQHLIEECITFNMSREECMEALSKHANIKPVITSTGKEKVWTELEKSNKDFFDSYSKKLEARHGSSSSQSETSERIPTILLDSSNKDRKQ